MMILRSLIEMMGLLLLVTVSVTFISGFGAGTDSGFIGTGSSTMGAAAGGLIIVGFTDDIDAVGFIGYVDSIAFVITL